MSNIVRNRERVKKIKDKKILYEGMKSSLALFIQNLIKLWNENFNIELEVKEKQSLLLSLKTLMPSWLKIRLDSKGRTNPYDYCFESLKKRTASWFSPICDIFAHRHIHEFNFQPDDFIAKENRTTLMKHFPSAFEMYSNTPPKQTPFSKLLDVAVKIGYTDETEIRTFAWTFLRHPTFLKGKTLDYLTMEPKVIAVCYMETQGEEPVKHYGSSLSFRRDILKNLMINWLCLEVWHEYVAYAVLSHKYKKPHSINFPEIVKCHAFTRKENVWTGEHVAKDPCSNCGKLFSLFKQGPLLTTPYGNCAEVECFSKLLNSGDAGTVVDGIRQDLEREGRYHKEWTDLRTRAERDYQNGWDEIQRKWEEYATIKGLRPAP